MQSIVNTNKIGPAHGFRRLINIVFCAIKWSCTPEECTPVAPAVQSALPMPHPKKTQPTKAAHNDFRLKARDEVKVKCTHALVRPPFIDVIGSARLLSIG